MVIMTIFFRDPLKAFNLYFESLEAEKTVEIFRECFQDG